MFVRWLVALTVATLAFAFLQEYWAPDSSTSRITPLPWTTAGGIVISQGLEMFQGLEAKEITSGENNAILLTLLMAFVVGPTMLFFSWRRLSVTPKKSVLSPANIGFFFGALITSFYLFGILVGAIIHPQIASSMRSAQAVGENRDMMIAGISRVALFVLEGAARVRCATVRQRCVRADGTSCGRSGPEDATLGRIRRGMEEVAGHDIARGDWQQQPRF